MRLISHATSGLALVALLATLAACSDTVDQGGDPGGDAQVPVDGLASDGSAAADDGFVDGASSDGVGASDTIAIAEVASEDAAASEVIAGEEVTSDPDTEAPVTDGALPPDLDGEVPAPDDALPPGPDGAVPAPGDVLPAVDLGEVGGSEVASDAVVEDIGPQDAVADTESPAVEDGGANPVSDAGDSAVADSGGEVVEDAPLYLLSVNNATHTLEKIDIATGAGTDLCQLATPYSYPSLTFSRDNVLYASRTGSSLDVIDPCTCAITPVGSYSGFTGVNGITSDFGLNLFGVAHNQDVLITIDATTGQGTSIGDLGVNFGYTGATWSESEQVVYAIDASSDGLYLIAPDTGVATLVAPLSQPMGTVGIEMHPANGLLYACSDAAHLLQIDIATGEVTDIGDMGQNTACNNLAAPWKSVECLE